LDIVDTLGMNISQHFSIQPRKKNLKTQHFNIKPEKIGLVFFIIVQNLINADYNFSQNNYVHFLNILTRFSKYFGCYVAIID